MPAKMRIEGFDEMDRNLAKVGTMPRGERLKEIGIKALQPVADTARGLVRQRSGQLARSIRVGDTLNPAQAAVAKPEPDTIELYVGAGALPQAITEEFGTVHEEGHPFMRPSWDSNVGEVIARLQQGASAALRDTIKG